jgi:uncharacterized protein (TIGR02466 family)
MKEIVRMFPTTVGFYNNSDFSIHVGVKEVVKDKLLTSSSNFFQTKTGVHKFKEFEKVNYFVKSAVFDFVKECGYDIEFNELYIADSWVNISTATATTHPPHGHSNSFISAVYYPQAPKGSGQLMFMHPCPQMHSIDPDHAGPTVDNSSQTCIDPEEGLCIVFRSSTIHGTTPNNLTDDERISVAYNFNVRNLGKNSVSSHYEDNE